MMKRLMRPSDAFFPLAGLICAFLGDKTQVLNYFTVYYAIYLCSFACTDAFRNAASRELRVARVEKRLGGVILPLAFGIAAFSALVHFFAGINIAEPAFIALTAASGLKIIEHMFEEYLFASSKSSDASLLSLIANLLLALGMLLDGGGIETPFAHFFTLCACALSAPFGAVISGALVRFPRISLVPANLGFAPKAMLQSLLYPAAALTAVYMVGFPVEAMLFGLLAWRLSRTLCRRTFSESRAMDLLMVLFTAAAVMGMLIVHVYPPYDGCISYAFAAFAALICAEILFLAPGVRLYLATLLLAGASAILILFPLPDVYNPISAGALCALAVLINLKHASLKRL